MFVPDLIEDSFIDEDIRREKPEDGSEKLIRVDKGLFIAQKKTGLVRIWISNVPSGLGPLTLHEFADYRALQSLRSRSDQKLNNKFVEQVWKEYINLKIDICFKIYSEVWKKILMYLIIYVDLLGIK